MKLLKSVHRVNYERTTWADTQIQQAFYVIKYANM